jgi:uncharacterized protein (TIGR02118 family)
MIKLIAFLKRNPGMTMAEFRDRWVYEHTKLSGQLPGLLGYRINVAVEDQPSGAEPLYDGTAELWWESREAMDASFASDIARIAGEDADSFCSVRIHLYTEEYTVVADRFTPPPPVR